MELTEKEDGGQRQGGERWRRTMRGEGGEEEGRRVALSSTNFHLSFGQLSD